MNVNCALFDKRMVAPDLVQQEASAVDALWVPEKKMEKLELARAKKHRKLPTIVSDVDAPG